MGDVLGKAVMEATPAGPLDGRRRFDDSLVRAVVVSGRLAAVTLGVVAAGLTALLVVNSVIYQPRFDRALDGAVVARLTHEAMLNQQAGLRGFLLSGDDRSLEAYQRGHDPLPELNRELDRLLAGSGRSGELLLEMRLAQHNWIDDWATEALERGRSHQVGVAVPDAFIEQDKTLFDVYRQRYDLFIAELVVRRDKAIRDQRWSLLVALGLLSTVAVGASAVSIRRSRALRRAVESPLRALLRRLDQIQRGDLTPRPVRDGLAEFQALGSGLEETAAALASARAEAEQHQQQIVARSRRQGEALALAREVGGSLNVEYVLRGLCTHAAAVADGARVVVWLMDESRAHLEPFADSAGPDLRPVGLQPLQLGDGLVGQAGQYGRVQGRPGEVSDADEGFAVPMVVGAKVVGVLEFVGPEVPQLTADAVETLETMAVHAATALDAAELHERTAEMAMTDVLTDLPNRRSLDADLQGECSSSARYNRPVAFFMVDIDHFKSYNDTFGHQGGDAALREVARVLTLDLRRIDKVYRYGGEEFALILRETTAEDAVALGERLRTAVEHHFAAPGLPRPLTVSIGIAGLPDHGPTPEMLTAAADGALYKAKEAGRNRVCVAAPSSSAKPVARRRLRPVSEAD